MPATFQEFMEAKPVLLKSFTSILKNGLSDNADCPQLAKNVIDELLSNAGLTIDGIGNLYRLLMEINQHIIKNDEVLNRLIDTEYTEAFKNVLQIQSMQSSTSILNQMSPHDSYSNHNQLWSLYQSQSQSPRFTEAAETDTHEATNDTEDEVYQIVYDLIMSKGSRNDSDVNAVETYNTTPPPITWGKQPLFDDGLMENMKFRGIDDEINAISARNENEKIQKKSASFSKTMLKKVWGVLGEINDNTIEKYEKFLDDLEIFMDNDLFREDKVGTLEKLYVTFKNQELNQNASEYNGNIFKQWLCIINTAIRVVSKSSFHTNLPEEISQFFKSNFGNSASKYIANALIMTLYQVKKGLAEDIDEYKNNNPVYSSGNTSEDDEKFRGDQGSSSQHSSRRIAFGKWR